jgi:outer membrane protein W
MRSYTITALALFVSAISFAQEADQMSLGPRLGVNISNVSNQDDTKSKLGLVGGLTFTYSFTETSGLTIDLLYSGEGFEAANGDKVSLNYLQLPIYYNVFFGELGSAFRPKVYAGIAPAFLLSAKSEDVDIKEFQNSINFSVLGGLGFNYRLSDRVWLNTDLRAFIGLTDVRDKDFRFTDETVASRNIQISLGVAYGLARIQ